MKILKCDQGTDEWLAARRGLPTASEFAPFMLKATTAAAKAARAKYICEKLTEAMPDDELEAKAKAREEAYLQRDPWITRGKVLEPAARRVLSKRIGKQIVEVGLCIHDSGMFGGSPDGLVIGDDGDSWVAGCEIKCHNRKRHLADLLAGKLPADHVFQVHGGMAITGLREWHYFGFHQALPSLHVVTPWDDFTSELRDGLLALGEEMAAMSKDLGRLFEAQESLIQFAEEQACAEWNLFHQTQFGRDAA